MLKHTERNPTSVHYQRRTSLGSYTFPSLIPLHPDIHPIHPCSFVIRLAFPFTIWTRNTSINCWIVASHRSTELLSCFMNDSMMVQSSPAQKRESEGGSSCVPCCFLSQPFVHQLLSHWHLFITDKTQWLYQGWHIRSFKTHQSCVLILLDQVWGDGIKSPLLWGVRNQMRSEIWVNGILFLQFFCLKINCHRNK